MKPFVHETSVVRRIWGSTDVVLFIFAGAAAEFALNKQVDWLYFTGKLPADPVGRLFSTVRYAQQIIFTDAAKARQSIDKINAIHGTVESMRGRSIPVHAYKNVLFMLIHYSIAACELLDRKLSAAEKDEVVAVFGRVGEHMQISGIPGSYDAWNEGYQAMLLEDIEYSRHTRHLFQQYKRHLGAARYWLLLEIQRMIVPPQVNTLLHLGSPTSRWLLVPVYKMIRRTPLQRWVIQLMVPAKFQQQVKEIGRWS